MIVTRQLPAPVFPRSIHISRPTLKNTSIPLLETNQVDEGFVRNIGAMKYTRGVEADLAVIPRCRAVECAVPFVEVASQIRLHSTKLLVIDVNYETPVS